MESVGLTAVTTSIFTTALSAIGKYVYEESKYSYKVKAKLAAGELTPKFQFGDYPYIPNERALKEIRSEFQVQIG